MKESYWKPWRVTLLLIWKTNLRIKKKNGSIRETRQEMTKALNKEMVVGYHNKIIRRKNNMVSA